MKRKRQSRILELIKEGCIETQDELLELLKKDGFVVTQATISRDIKELRLIKMTGSDGRYKYMSAKSEAPDISAKFFTMFTDSVEGVDAAQNIVCVKCYSGMAQAVCASMDNVGMDEVVGSLAGEDTIFLLCSTNDDAASLKANLLKML